MRAERELHLGRLFTAYHFIPSKDCCTRILCSSLLYSSLMPTPHTPIPSIIPLFSCFARLFDSFSLSRHLSLNNRRECEVRIARGLCGHGQIQFGL